MDSSLYAKLTQTKVGVAFYAKPDVRTSHVISDRLVDRVESIEEDFDEEFGEPSSPFSKESDSISSSKTTVPTFKQTSFSTKRTEAFQTKSVFSSYLLLLHWLWIVVFDIAVLFNFCAAPIKRFFLHYSLEMSKWFLQCVMKHLTWVFLLIGIYLKLRELLAGLRERLTLMTVKPALSSSLTFLLLLEVVMLAGVSIMLAVCLIKKSLYPSKSEEGPVSDQVNYIQTCKKAELI